MEVQLTTRTTDFFVVAKMSVDLVGFVNLVGIGYMAYMDPRDFNKFDQFTTICVSGLVEPLSFFLSFVTKPEILKNELNFLAKKLSLLKAA